MSAFMSSSIFEDLATALVKLRAVNCDFTSSWLDPILGCTD